jgi:hypothetical protein
MGIQDRLTRSLRNDGVFETLVKGVRLPFVMMANFRNELWLKWITRTKPASVVFGEIYKRNYWGNESVSGFGSTLVNTATMRRDLSKMIDELGMKSVYDAPCGDFNWMSEVTRMTGLIYRGEDIVPQLIEANSRKYSGPAVSFGVADITSSTFPEADLWICRECFFHLSYADIYRALDNFVRSEIPHMLTTTYVRSEVFANRDIYTGEFRMIDLFDEPFFFPREVEYRIDDTPQGDNPRELCLWTREQIARALPRFKSVLTTNASR